MGIIQMLIPIVGADGYIISRALRFNSGDSPLISRTPRVAGNRRTWTWSGWIKRTAINNGANVRHWIFIGGNTASDTGIGFIGFKQNDDLLIGSNNTDFLLTTRKFRDLSAWYHIVVAFDSTQATASNRIKVYVNGVEETSFSTDNRSSVTQNGEYGWNRAERHTIGSVQNYGGNTPQYIDAYMADLQFIDGQALAVTEFGKFNDAGVWIPKKYDGTFGTNGFRLNFDEVDSTQKLGYDVTQEVTLDPKAGMNVVTYTGTHARLNVGGLNFEPGLVWIKNRNSGTSAHFLADSVRGGTKVLQSNSTGTENTRSDHILSFNPDGFTLGADGTSNYPSGNSFVAWAWRAGGPAVANTDGTTTSQVSANTDYGFSIVTYTGGTSDATIGHGLGQTPKFYIVKARTNSGYTDSWNVYHTSLGASAYIKLNDAGGKTTPSTIWNETAPTSTVFSVDASSNANENNTDYVAYVWSEVSGYSKFGSYTGNGSDNGALIETGFRPRWILIKSHYASNSNAHSHWLIYDTERSPTNEADDLLLASGTNAEFSSAHTGIDILDNGFKLKADSLGYANFNTNQYIYAAFADRPGNNWDVNNIVTNEGLSTSKQNFDVVTWTGNGGTLAVGQPVYSDQTTGGNNTSNMFDGSSSSWNNLTAGNTITFTPSPAIACTQLDIWVDTGTPIRVNVNGGGYGSTFTQSGLGYVNITPGGGMTSLTSLLIDAPSGGGGTGAGIRGLRINGTTIIVDGNGGPGLKFQPDLVWLKSRSHTYDHYLTDSVRGATKSLRSNTTAAEDTLTQGLTAFNSDGFTLGNEGQFNNTGRTYVGWCWKAGGTPVSNADGTITSSVSANAAYGFSIIKFTTASNTSGGATVGHGLGAQPSLYIYKPTSTTGEWVVVSSHDYSKFAYLNATTRFRSISSEGGGTPADPTNSVLSVYDLGVTLASKTYICYAFANVPGYQRVGAYTGNGSSSGPVIVTGFKPRFLLAKKESADGRQWLMLDSQRNPSDTLGNRLYAESTAADDPANIVNFVDNGFEIISATSDLNDSGATYIYLAIADDEIGADEDVLVDVPSEVEDDADATDTTGGYQRGNYATLNPFDKSSGLTLSNGNLQLSTSSGHNNFEHARSTIGVTSGKWYCEYTATNGRFSAGVATSTAEILDRAIGDRAGTFGIASDGINLYKQGYPGSSHVNLGNTYLFAPGDTCGIAFDANNGTLDFYKNGVLISGTSYTGLSTSDTYHFVAGDSHNGSPDIAQGVINFGQMRFKYPVPSGYAALNTTALPAATIADGSAHFDIKTWTGNGGTQSISNLEFSPDLVWIKARNHQDPHALFDTVRGVQKRLSSNLNNAEVTSADGITSFNADGWTMGANGSNNANNLPYVAWCWNAGANSNKTYTVKVVSDSGNKYRFDDFGTSAVTLDLAEGSTYVFDQSDSSNAGHPLRFSTTANGTHGGGTEYTTGVTVTGTPGQAGAKTTIVVAASAPTLFYYCNVHSGMGGQANTNATAGSSNFDGSLQATVKANPEAGFSIVKVSGPSNAGFQSVGHGLNAKPEFIICKDLDNARNWSVYHKDSQISDIRVLPLNQTVATFNSGTATWDISEINNTTFTPYFRDDYGTSFNAENICYCFAPVAGFSAFGSYTGNGSNDGPFVYTGFRPGWLMIRRTDATSNWVIIDAARSSFNEVNDLLYAEQSLGETVDDGNNGIDFLSNGFKLRKGVGGTNANGGTLIYIAFAENPLQANNGIAR